MRSPTSRELIRRAGRAVLALWVIGWALFIAPACGPGQYIYDPNGRLVAVLDPTQDNSGGGTAIYNYDPAGNLVSISRQQTTALAILSFTPSCGSAGSSSAVTINGTGFSTTAANNVVTFPGGTTQAATAATANQLVVPVPAGAAGVGTLTVRVSGGPPSPPSVQSFTVGCGAPTITDFTTCTGTAMCSATPSCCLGTGPGNGVTATAVTVHGTNFDTTAAAAANDRLTFHHNRLASVGTPSTSQIMTTAPSNTTSGKLILSTPLGFAVSPLDFFAPPPGWGITNVDPDPMVMRRMPNPTVAGQPWPVKIPSPDANNAPRIGLALFDATLGDTPCWYATNTNNLTGYTNLSLFDPDGNYLPLTSALSGPSGNSVVTMAAPTRASPLPATGTYTFVTQPNSGTTGTVTLTAYTASATFKAIVPTLAGAVVPVMPTGPCQQTWLRFTGTAGHRLTATTSNVSPNFVYTMNFYNGSVTSNPTGGTDCLRIGPLQNSDAGPWQLLVTTNGPGQSTGSLTVTVYDILDALTSTSIDSTAHTATVHLVVRAPGEFPTVQFMTLPSPNPETLSVTIPPSSVNPPYSFGFGPAATLLDANKQYVTSGVTGFGPVSVSPNATYFVQLSGGFVPCWVGSADVMITNNTN